MAPAGFKVSSEPCGLLTEAGSGFIATVNSGKPRTDEHIARAGSAEAPYIRFVKRGQFKTPPEIRFQAELDTLQYFGSQREARPQGIKATAGIPLNRPATETFAASRKG
jgi:hypothetical protein